jgi:phage N-6-adenine-methyltransferase
MIWTTPQPIFDALDREFHFAIDLCADYENAKCYEFLDRRRSLSQSWDGAGVAWLNPPYGREISLWTAKALQTRRKIVSFLPGRTNAPWWHDHVMQAREIRFVRRKVSFANNNGCKGVPPWGAVVVIWEWDYPGKLAAVSWDWKNNP